MDEKLIKVLLQRLSDKDVKEVLTTLQEENVRENTQREAPSSRSSSVSSGTRKRKCPSDESEQDHGNAPKKQQRPLDLLAKLIASDTVIPVPKIEPIQGYVTREKYCRLKDKYNNLLADYAALRQRFQLTLDCLGDSGVDSDVNEEYNAHNVENNYYNEETVKEDILESQKEEYEDVSQALPEEVRDELNDQSSEGCNGELSEQNNKNAPEKVKNATQVTNSEEEIEDQQEDDTEDIIVNTDDYVSSQQWIILGRTRVVKLFVENVLRILFDKETLLKCSVPGKTNSTSSQTPGEMLDPKRIGVLKVLLKKYLDEKEEPPFTEEEKKDGTRNVMQYVSHYVNFLKQKHKEGVDVTYL